MGTVTPEEALRFYEAYYGGVVISSEFMEKRAFEAVKPLIRSNDREELAYNLYHRAMFWMRSLVKLNSPDHFQALVSANRSMLEMAIDFVFIRHDATNTIPDQILAWEQSAKLNQAEKLLSYYTKDLGMKVPPHANPISQFAQQSKATIESRRDKYWPKRSRPHPDRWTGRGLGADASEADKLENLKLREFYETDYRILCWNVHGSGLAGARGLKLSTFHLMCAKALDHCAIMGLEIARLMLQIIANMWTQDPRLKEDFDQAKIKKGLLVIKAAEQQPGA